RQAGAHAGNGHCGHIREGGPRRNVCGTPPCIVAIRVLDGWLPRGQFALTGRILFGESFSKPVGFSTTEEEGPNAESEEFEGARGGFRGDRGVVRDAGEGGEGPRRAVRERPAAGQG